MKKILIIDDSVIQLELMRAALRKAGYTEISVAESFEEGVGLIKSKAPDIIVCDIVLVNETGYDVCRKIKSMNEPTAKVVLLTSSIDKFDALNARDAGADDIVIKNSNFSALVESVGILSKD